MKKFDFISIDCEKASNCNTSICSIGIVGFKNGKPKFEKEYIIKPYPFKFYKGSIIDNSYHGVPVSVYEKAPTLFQIWPKIKKLLEGNIIIGHGINGDIQIIQGGLEHYNICENDIDLNNCICTNIASIYIYPEIESHKLKSLCDALEIEVNPHHALSDARAAGYLLLDMMNVTDCKTALDFIDICNEYTQIITNKYTDKNIEKYEEKIKTLFNHSDFEIEMIKKQKNIVVTNIIDFFKKEVTANIPELKIECCLTPIIEIYKNENYKPYSDEIIMLKPFSRDDFLYLKTGENQYTLFVGVLSDKTALISNLILFLTRLTTPVFKDNYIGKCYSIVNKYKNGIYTIAQYLYDNENFEEIDVYKYIEYLYMEMSESFNSYDFKTQYNLIFSANTFEAIERSLSIYKRGIANISKLIGIYLGLRKSFKNRTEELKFPDYFNGTFPLIESIIGIFELDKNDEICLDNFDYLINKWYHENIKNINIV